MARLVIIHGARDLRRTLRQAGIDIRQTRDVNRRVATLVAGRAKGTAPKRTGRLARSVRGGATQRAAVVRAGRKSVPYAGPIHWGWPARNIEAQPWLTEAAQGSESEWVGLFADFVDDVLSKIRGA